MSRRCAASTLRARAACMHRAHAHATCAAAALHAHTTHTPYALQVQFDDPPMECLGPVGEYNLRLGIIKELSPDMVATHQDAGCTHEGHPTIVEAGVCLGGKAARSDAPSWQPQS